MKLNFRSLLVFVALLSLVLAGCALPHNAPPFFIINPNDRAVFPTGSSIRVEYKTNIPPDPNRVEFDVKVYDNGTLVHEQLYPGTFSDASWTIPNETAGGHLLSAQGRAINRDGSMSPWYATAVVCTFVGTPPSGSDFCSLDYYQYAQGLQAAPTNTPTPTPIPVIDSAQAYPNPIYYGQTCPSLSTITFRAALTLPNGITPDQVEVQAHVSAIVGSNGSSSGTLLVPLQPNGTWDASSGGQVFLGTIALTHPYNDANNNFDPAALGGNSGALLWYVDASSHAPSNQTYLGRSANQVINLSPCPVISSLNPSNQSRNGGTSGSKSGCGQYTNQVSCNLGGCAWNPQNSSCTVNP